MPDRVPLAVFHSREDYAAFAPRLAAHYGANVSPPKSDGFTILGTASSSYDPVQGFDRPVFVHEVVHAAVERLLGLASSGNWVQEALASAVQATLFPKSLESVDLAAGVAALAKGEKGTFLPWKDLLGKPHPAMGRYPQLITVVGFQRVKYREKPPRVRDALRALDGSVHEKALPAIAAALESTAADLERGWLEWGVGYYRK